MKRTDLIRRVSRAAREAGVSWRLVRNGRRHDVWECDSMPIAIPRHRELNELTTRAIMKVLEEKLGKDWWR
jgi:mRNA interferase HicA